MSSFDFDEIIDRKGTSSVKLDLVPELYPGAPKDSLPLWVADMDFACPPCALEAIKARVDRKILGYTGFFDPDYFKAFIGFERRIHNLEVRQEWVVFSSGVVSALRELVTRLSNPGEAVMINTPAYAPFREVVLTSGRKLVLSPLQVDKRGRYYLDYGDMERRMVEEDVKVLIFCSPHNPTGRVWKEDELRNVHHLCRKHSIHIISDEIHCDLTRRNIDHIPLIRLFPEDDDIYTCTAPSKTFNLAGLHLSNILIKNKALRDSWAEESPCGEPSPFALEAAKACFAKGDEWLGELRDYLDGNVHLVQEFVKKELPKAVFFPPEGTYLAWIDLSGYRLKDRDILKRCTEQGLLIENASNFVQDGEGHIRLNLATPKAVLREACSRLKKAIIR